MLGVLVLPVGPPLLATRMTSSDDSARTAAFPATAPTARHRLPHPWPYCGCSVLAELDSVAELSVVGLASVAGPALLMVAARYLQVGFALTVGTADLEM